MARVLVSMKDEFLNQVDQVAEAEQRSRSELIREALREYIRKSTLNNRLLRDQDLRNMEAFLD